MIPRQIRVVNTSVVTIRGSTLRVVVDMSDHHVTYVRRCGLRLKFPIDIGIVLNPSYSKFVSKLASSSLRNEPMSLLECRAESRFAS